jgi:murein DD-endopeptidase MepM/ murein hydrolase activator NlpD
MQDRGRQRRVEHARYVGSGPGTPNTPNAPSKYLKPVWTLDRRVAGGLAAVLVVAVAIVAASTFSGGTPRPATAADLATAAASPATPAASPAPNGTSAGAASAEVSQAPATGDPPPPSLPLGAPTGYRWPLAIGRITTAFAPEAGGLFIVDGEPFHDGIDIASFCGDHIVAAHDGVVIASGRHVENALGWVGDIAGYEAHLTAKNLWGSQAVMVITDDGNGYRSVYVHLFKSLVKVGQRLKAGDLVGYEGRTGDATGCHLHFSIFSPSDPRLFITDPAVVKKSDLPTAEVARIDPLSVLPAISTTAITWGWGVKPLASPAP